MSFAPSPITTPVSYQESVGCLESEASTREIRVPWEKLALALPSFKASSVSLLPASSSTPAPISTLAVCGFFLVPTPAPISEYWPPARLREPGMPPWIVASVLALAYTSIAPVVLTFTLSSTAWCTAPVVASPFRLPAAVRPTV